MKRRSHATLAAPGRRRILKQSAALGVAAIAAPYVLRSAHAQANADIAPYTQAKINWRQAEGEQIAVAFIPASYFDNLIAIAPTFEALSGVKVRFEKVPRPVRSGRKRCSTCRRRRLHTRRRQRTRCITHFTYRTNGSSRSTSIWATLR